MGWERLPPSGLLSIGSVQPSAPALAWTGKELLVAGVEDRRRDGEVRRGSRAFDASAVEWRVIRDPPTADALWGVGFWSGREMLVWRYPSMCEDSREQGLAYDPETDVWRLLPPRPVDDSGGDVAWVAGKMFVRAGGWGPFPDPSSNVASLYDPLTDRWTLVPPAPVEPRYASAVTADEGRVFVWGGGDADGGTSDGAIYDVAENVWEPTGRAPISRRYGSGAVWTEKEFIVWSGTHATKTRERRVRDCAAYEPVTRTWRQIATAPTSRGSSMVWVGDEVITWWAGSEYEPKASCLGYRPEGDTWRVVPDDGAMPEGPGVWTGMELYVWAPHGPGHDFAAYRPGPRQPLG